MEFSAEKVLKNRFFNKFRGIFRGKNVRKIGPEKNFPRKNFRGIQNFAQKCWEKNTIFRGKSFEKSFFQEIPRKKMYEKSAPVVISSANLQLQCYNVCNIFIFPKPDWAKFWPTF
jgi:hypothetical protein